MIAKIKMIMKLCFGKYDKILISFRSICVKSYPFLDFIITPITITN